MPKILGDAGLPIGVDYRRPGRAWQWIPFCKPGDEISDYRLYPALGSVLSQKCYHTRCKPLTEQPETTERLGWLTIKHQGSLGNGWHA
jgi:hypothetical protein